MAKRAEKHYKCPQDIEWALRQGPSGRGEPPALSRPETVHSSKKESAAPAKKKPATGMGGLTAALLSKNAK